MLIAWIWVWSVYIWTVEATVLDPALFLSPSPPFTDTIDDPPPAALWSRDADIRNIQNSGDIMRGIYERSTRRNPRPVEKARLFWPTSRPREYSLGNIQIPLTFGLSGTYGRYSGNVGMGVIGSSYATIADAGNSAISALAGSGYGAYRSVPGLRIFGRESAPSWSGWGNGKWGHYGTG